MFHVWPGSLPQWPANVLVPPSPMRASPKIAMATIQANFAVGLLLQRAWLASEEHRRGLSHLRLVPTPVLLTPPLPQPPLMPPSMLWLLLPAPQCLALAARLKPAPLAAQRERAVPAAGVGLVVLAVFPSHCESSW